MRELHSLTGNTREVKFNYYFPLIRLLPHKLRVDIARHQLVSHRQWSSRTINVRLARGEGRQQGNTARYEKAIVVHPLTGLLLTQYLPLTTQINEFADTLIAVETQLRQKIRELDRQLLKTTNSFQVFLFLPNCTYPIYGDLKRPLIHQVFPPKIIV